MKKYNNCTWASDLEADGASHLFAQAWEPRDGASADVQGDDPSRGILLPATASSVCFPFGSFQGRVVLLKMER